MNKYELLQNMAEKGEAEQYFTEDLESTAQNLRSAGLDFSLEELQDLAMAYKSSLNEGSELSVDDLEMVSGGAFNLPNPFKGIKLKDIFSKGENNWFNKYLGNLEKITRGGY